MFHEPKKYYIFFLNLFSNANITTNVSKYLMLAAQFLYVLPCHSISSSRLCSLGYGLPFSISVQIAHMDKCVICVSGDAHSQMNLQ